MQLTNDQSKLITDRLSDRWWRLNNLYYIIDEDGKKVLFSPRMVQKEFYDKMWYLNIILKGRQMGFTTFIQIFILDACLFQKDVAAGVVAHNREDAEDFFHKKIKFAYDNLPFGLNKVITAESDSARALSFSNGSSIRVGASLRSGTYQYLHISEFGKICAKFPDKAEEVISGALNTVHAGSYIFIESTAEGDHGRFYEMCQDAMKHNGKLTELDYRFFFYPWWRHKSYALSGEVTEDKRHTAYFSELEKRGIVLDREQKNWYIKKEAVQRSKMSREFPSTSDEAFESIVEYSIYGEALAKLKNNGRVKPLVIDPMLPVHTFWDIGRSKTDSTTIWFMQDHGKEYHFIDYEEGFQKPISDYVTMLEGKGYRYGTHYLPHDASHNNYDMKTYQERLAEAGIVNTEIVPRTPDLAVAIDETRNKLPYCWFDNERCAKGLSALAAYAWQYDVKNSQIKEPLHNWASHPADSFRQFAQGYKEYVHYEEPVYSIPTAYSAFS